MVETRPLVARRADVASDSDEPILSLARRKVANEGGSLRQALKFYRDERRERAKERALADAPVAQKNVDGSYARVSRDPRWPFGIENELILAPFGLSECGLPRTLDKADNKSGGRKNVQAARTEAREIIMDKLQRMGCDPIAIMAELAMASEEKSEVRLRAAAELASMIYPRLRGVESLQRQEKTVFVIGIPEARPATPDAWLAQAAGVRQIATAVSEAEVIEGESIEVTPK